MQARQAASKLCRWKCVNALLLSNSRQTPVQAGKSKQCPEKVCALREWGVASEGSESADRISN